MLNNSREENQTCLAYGQLKMVPLSPSFLNQRGPVRFFYCSTKGFNAYSDEGLTNVMFFKSELEDTKKRVEEKGHKKRKRPETGHVSRLCRFCKKQLKQGSNSPHIHIHVSYTYTYIHMCSPHTGFPRVAGKYVHCHVSLFHLPTSEHAER